MCSKKLIVDSQQISPNLPDTAKEGQKIPRTARSNVLKLNSNIWEFLKLLWDK